MSEFSSSPNHLKEALSALIDDEAGVQDALELRRLSQHLETDPSLLDTYQRFSAVSAVMRGDALNCSEPTRTTFVDQVRARIDEEYSMQAAVGAVSWTGRLAQMAVAASVAAVAILLVQGIPLSEEKTMVLNAHPVHVSTPESAALGTQNNRLLNPQVLNVAAGNRHARGQTDAVRPMAFAADCAIYDGAELAANERIMRLPEGLVLCQLADGQRPLVPSHESPACRQFSSAMVCRLK